MTVARMLGRTAAEIDQNMSAAELADWIAFLRLEAEDAEKARRRAEMRRKR